MQSPCACSNLSFHQGLESPRRYVLSTLMWSEDQYCRILGSFTDTLHTHASEVLTKYPADQFLCLWPYNISRAWTVGCKSPWREFLKQGDNWEPSHGARIRPPDLFSAKSSLGDWRSIANEHRFFDRPAKKTCLTSSLRQGSVVLWLQALLDLEAAQRRYSVADSEQISGSFFS